MTSRSGLTGIWVIATGVIIGLLYLGRDILAPFALAIFLFLIIEGFARAIHGRSAMLKLAWSRALAILVVIGGFVGFLAMMARGIAEFGIQGDAYLQRINALIEDAYSWVHLSDAPTLTEMVFNESGQAFLGTIASATSGLTGDLVLILIYVAFLFLAQSAWPNKLDRIFVDGYQRKQVKEVGHAARGHQHLFEHLVTLHALAVGEAHLHPTVHRVDAVQCVLGMEVELPAKHLERLLLDCGVGERPDHAAEPHQRGVFVEEVHHGQVAPRMQSK